jgi:hypothetical protein
MSGFTSLGKKGSNGLGGGGSFNANSIGPFGTALVSQMTPVAQGTFVFGINDAIWKSQLSGLGPSVTVSNGIASCISGNEPYASSALHLNRACKYRAGQGVMSRFTAIFDEGKIDTKQFAGIGNNECGYYFAMSGSNFGIVHRERSKCEIREFTITTGVGAGTALTITLGGSTKSITISGGSNANQTAYLISKQNYSNVGTGWKAEAHSNKVYFIAHVPGPVGGSFNITNGVSSIASVIRTQAGELPLEKFIPQSLWNVDTMDGSGPSRFTLDPQKGNIYGIGYQYLGFGNPTFSIENPKTGLLTQCHMIQRAGEHTTTVVNNPMMSTKYESINSGSAAASVTVQGASAASFIEGTVTRNIGISFAASSIKTSIGANEIPVLSLRSNNFHNGVQNYGEIAPFNISMGNDTGNSSTGKLLQIQIYKNLNLTGPVNFTNIDINRSIASIDTAATGVTTASNSLLLKSIIVAANDSILLNLENENFFLVNGDTLTITAKRAGNSDIDTAAISISWFEDQ